MDKKKKKEVNAEIQLHEVVVNIDLLGEIKDGGLNVEEELCRLKEMEKDCKAVVELAAILNWSFYDLDIPQILEDSVTGDHVDLLVVGEQASSC
ncbi:hypothetical protein N665_0218s0074 [Sinapis alba]|nr:hypothetical protein N665_0218s0074 [Sinapis alba]